MSLSTRVPITAPRMELEEFHAEIAQQTSEEQAKANADLYGKEQSQPEETDEFLNEKLQALSDELEQITVDKEAYDTAVERCPEYVKDRDFELLFLRADYFDAGKAATRMVAYWKAKLKAFGPDKTFKRTTLDDLTDDDLASLKKGTYAVLPNRDKAGRAVFFSWNQKLVYKERSNMIRLLWYLVHATLEGNVDVQQKGVVLVVFEQGFQLTKYDRKLDKLLFHHSSHVWPVRWVGFHYCFDSKLNEIIIPLGLMMMGKTMRARFKLHPGSRLDSRFEALADFGLERKHLPQLMDGTLEFDGNAWIEQRRTQGL